MLPNILTQILQTSAYASVVGIAILLFKATVKNRLSPRWHYWIWIILILKLILPFGPESTASFFNILPDPALITNIVADTPAAQSQDYGSALQPDFVVNPNNTQNSVDSSQAPLPSKSSYNLHDILSYSWFAGVIILSLWLLWAYSSLYLKLRRSKVIQEQHILKILEKEQQRLRIKRSFSLICQNTIKTPALLGVITPKILLTPTCLQLNDKELAHVLLHELAHYKRKDNWVNILLVVLQTIHWFNPILWFCFTRIRQDMELAADAYVLESLDSSEHKAYGNTLIAYFEQLSSPRVIPQLLGMASGKKMMERRIKMIKLAKYFNRKKGLMLLFGLVGLLLLGSIFLTNSTTAEQNNDLSELSESQGEYAYDADSLYLNKSLYIGDHVNVGELLTKLPFAQYGSGISLATQNKPFGLTANYVFQDSEYSAEQLPAILQKNALIAFALIDNLDKITFNALIDDGAYSYQFSRTELQQGFATDLRDYAVNQETFREFIKQLSLQVLYHPERYTLAMSSAQGLYFNVNYPLHVEKVHYETEQGAFLVGSNSVTQLEVPYGEEVCWQPSFPANGVMPDSEPTTISVTLLDTAGEVITSKSITIINQEGWYMVQPSYGVAVKSSEQLPTSLSTAVSQAIKKEEQKYLQGECFTEGHLILDSVEDEKQITVYAIVSEGWFGFENGIFTKVSGSGAIPTVFQFSRNDDGSLELLSCQQPLDGSEYSDSVKGLFPARLHNRVLQASDFYPDLLKMQEAQAAAYLQTIGRVAEVRGGHVDKILADINTEASNKLVAELTKYDAFLNSCPYWLGTREQIEDGVRYIYEKAQSKTSDGHDLITFTKSTAEGEIIEQRFYKIVGSEPQLIDKPE